MEVSTCLTIFKGPKKYVCNKNIIRSRQIYSRTASAEAVLDLFYVQHKILQVSSVKLLLYTRDLRDNFFLGVHR